MKEAVQMRKDGAVLIFALVTMGMITILTQQLMKSVSVGLMFTSRMVIREQVEMLAYGGLSVAMVQLEECYQEEKKKDEASAQKKGAVAKKFSFQTCITTIVPHLNRWQVFELHEEIDGLDGRIQICICVEEGKIPLSVLFNEPARDSTPGAKQLLKSFSAVKKMPAGDVVAKLTTALKKRTTQLQDISGLLGCARELKVPFWYEPSPVPNTQKKEKATAAPFAVQDMCTLWASSGRINPLFLTSAVCMILGLRMPLPGDAVKRKDQYKQLSENYDKIKTSSGDELWKNMGLVYDAKPKIPSEFSNLFSLEVEPRFYSVLCCATVAGVTQQLLAIIEREAPPAPVVDRRGKDPKKSNEKQPLFAIRRLYWL
jgi:hypothetical protein